VQQPHGDADAVLLQ